MSIKSRAYRCPALSRNLVFVLDSLGNPTTSRNKYFVGIIQDSVTGELIPCYKEWIKYWPHKIEFKFNSTHGDEWRKSGKSFNDFQT